MSSREADSSRGLAPWRPVVLSPLILDLLRPASTELAEAISHRIAKDIKVSRRARKWERRVRDGVKIAIAGFFADHEAVVAAHMFHDFGRMWAAAGSGPVPVMEAIQIALDLVRESVHQIAERDGLSKHASTDIVNAATTYLAHLRVEVERGHREARIALSDSRAVLLSALLKGRPHQRPLEDLVSAASWSLPEQLVVLVADLHRDRATLDLGAGPEVLAFLDGDQIAAACDPAYARRAQQAMRDIGDHVVVAQMWPVPAEKCRDAYRWARQALTLAERGKIQPVRRVVRCVDHRLTLWIERDHVLAHSIGSELLEPLLRLGRARRRTLGRTMLRWLQTRDSAPVLGEHFGVHPNTVRNHQTALYRLFGPQLDDPDMALTFILALKAMRDRLE